MMPNAAMDPEYFTRPVHTRDRADLALHALVLAIAIGVPRLDRWIERAYRRSATIASAVRKSESASRMQALVLGGIGTQDARVRRPSPVVPSLRRWTPPIRMGRSAFRDLER